MQQSKCAAQVLAPDADKGAVRAAARARRDGLPASYRAAWSAAIVGHIQNWLVRRPDCVRIGLYKPMATEVDVLPLVAWCQAHGRQAYAPRVEAGGADLLFVPVDAQTHWRRTQGGFETPAGQGVALAALQVVFVPGLLFDDAGFRIGWGGGHYDRALLNLPAHAIGVGFRAQRVRQLPVEAHDRRLDAFVDEVGFFAPT